MPPSQGPGALAIDVSADGSLVVRLATKAETTPEALSVSNDDTTTVFEDPWSLVDGVYQLTGEVEPAVLEGWDGPAMTLALPDGQTWTGELYETPTVHAFSTFTEPSDRAVLLSLDFRLTGPIWEATVGGVSDSTGLAELAIGDLTSANTSPGDNVMTATGDLDIAAGAPIVGESRRLRFGGCRRRWSRRGARHAVV